MSQALGNKMSGRTKEVDVHVLPWVVQPATLEHMIFLCSTDLECLAMLLALLLHVFAAQHHLLRFDVLTEVAGCSECLLTDCFSNWLALLDLTSPRNAFCMTYRLRLLLREHVAGVGRFCCKLAVVNVNVLSLRA